MGEGTDGWMDKEVANGWKDGSTGGRWIYRVNGWVGG